VGLKVVVVPSDYTKL